VNRVDNIGTMNTPPENPGGDDPQAIAKALAKPIEAIWKAFDRGRAGADEFFAADDRRMMDPHLWAHLARYEAVLSLKEEPKSESYDWAFPHHSGIKLIAEPYRVLVCKAAGDDPQSPGRNRSRKEFFQQLSMTLFGGPRTANLVLWWRVRKGALELALCKPKGLWRFRESAKLEWQVPIEYDPLAGLTFRTPPDEELTVRLEREEGFEDEVSG